MKTNRIIKNLTALALLSAFSLQPSALLGQGSLTPPGQPAPTMKSADQIYSKLDPRTPISYAPFIITNSGSYYLTTNLTVSSGDAIDINTNGVTLDLNGFTISSTATGPNNSAILLNGCDITIVNGHIRSGGNNPGFVSGIMWDYSVTNVVISKVSVVGVWGSGIYLGAGNATVVEDCTVTAVNGYGIVASIIKSSVATDCGSTAIDGDQVTDCRGISTGSSMNSGVDASGTAQNCYGQSSSGTGLQASTAIGCIGYSTSGCGLQATIANSCIIAHGTTNVTYHCNMPW